MLHHNQSSGTLMLSDLRKSGWAFQLCILDQVAWRRVFNEISSQSSRARARFAVDGTKEEPFILGKPRSLRWTTGTDQFPILELRMPIAKRKQAGNSRRFAEQELL